MKRILLAAAVSAGMALGGCSMLGPLDPARTASAQWVPGSELPGRTLRMQTRAGQVTLLDFRRDGQVRARFNNQSIQGQWRVEPNRLCFQWSGAPRECWPYREPFRRGESRVITSDRGNEVRVTLL